MGKVKLAVSIGDEKYMQRFCKCLINHYNDQYEIHMFATLAEVEKTRYEAIITGDCDVKKVVDLIGAGEKVIYLQESLDDDIAALVTEEEREKRHLVFVDKYQEVYKIMDQIKTIIDINSKVGKHAGEREVRRIGIYSLVTELAQLPYGAMLADIYGEQHSVLLIDLMPYSGLMRLEEGSSIEDLLVAVTTGNYTKTRILSGIGHMQKWDYIYPAKNAENLAEGNREAYEAIMEILVQEQGYDIIIVNFGEIFPGVFDIMDSCQEFHMLETKETTNSWRERDFINEMERKGKNSFLNRIVRIKVPTISCGTGDWIKQAQRWLWSELGDHVRGSSRRSNLGG